MNYHNITTDDMLNGDGLRTVLWVTWDPNGGLEFDIYAEAELYSNIYPEHISGVTFSGGDPFHPKNRDTILRLAKDIKERISGKTVWMYTGYLWEEIYDYPGMQYIDVVVDGKIVKRVIDVKKSFETGKVVLHKSTKEE